jgi:hypothetical protein
MGRSGGAQPGSGRPPSPAHLVRDERLAIQITAQDRADLEACAVAWDSPVGTVAAFLLMQTLSDARGEALATGVGTALERLSQRAARALRGKGGL